MALTEAEFDRVATAGFSQESSGESIKKDLRSRLSELEYKIWLADLQIKTQGERLSLHTPSDTKREKISEKYWKLLIELAGHYFPGYSLGWLEEGTPGSPPSLSEKEETKEGHREDGEGGDILPRSQEQSVSESSSDREETKNPPNKNKSKSEGEGEGAFASPPAQNANHSSRRILPENTLEDFLEIPENKLARRFISKGLELPGAINPIYLYGSVGVGKTHLLHAFAHAYRQRVPFAKIEYLTPDDFVSDFTRALHSKSDRHFRTYYRSLDALLIDDIQFFMGKEKSSQEFFHVFNAIHASGKQMIFTSDRDPRELEQLDDRLKSRISSSAIIEIKAPGIEGRRKLIQFYVEKWGLPISEEVMDFLSQNLPGDIRQLVGAIRYLSALQALGGQEDSASITTEYCKEYLKQLQTQRPKQERYHPEKILYGICEHTGVSLKDLKSSKKSKQLSRYRQTAMYLLRQYTDLSLPEIGFMFGGRSVSSVTYGIEKITSDLADKNGGALNEDLDQILKKTSSVSMF